jgi:hypothetical protein
MRIGRLSIFVGMIILSINACCGYAGEPFSTGLEGFWGHVQDNSGYPIQGAVVSWSWRNATTDADGYYEIFVGHRLGSGDLICKKNGYFIQTQHNTDPEGGQYDFQLAKNPDAWVTVTAFFPNTPYASIEYATGYQITVTVDCYSGGFGTTLTWNEEKTTSIGGSYPPFSYRRKTEASGAYDGSGSLLDLFIKRPREEYDEFYETEYLNPNTTAGTIYGILPGNYVEQTVTKTSGSVTLQGGLKTSIGVGIYGVSISEELQTTIALTYGNTIKIQWFINNGDAGYKHYFKVYYEGNMIVHIWDIGKERVNMPASGGGGGGATLPIAR